MHPLGTRARLSTVSCLPFIFAFSLSIKGEYQESIKKIHLPMMAWQVKVESLWSRGWALGNSFPRILRFTAPDLISNRLPVPGRSPAFVGDGFHRLIVAALCGVGP